MLLNITQTGTTVTSGATSAIVAIPNPAAGTGLAPGRRAVRLVSDSAVFVKLIIGASGTATTNDILVTTYPILVNVTPYDHIAYIQDTAAGKLNIIPLEV